MLNKPYTAPLIAAFFCALGLTTCTQDGNTTQTQAVECSRQTTPIAVIQGSASRSGLTDRQVSIQGIITLVDGNEGLYVEEPGSDDDGSTSNAIFLQTANLPAGIGPGSRISAQGTVTEIPRGRNSLTSLTNIVGLTQCSTGQVLPLSHFTLPSDGHAREAFEGMRVRLDGALTVTDTYAFGHGRFSIAGNGIQWVATEHKPPGPELGDHARQNRDYSLPLIIPDQATRPALLATGSNISKVVGVLVHGKRNLLLSLQSADFGTPAEFGTPTPIPPAAPADAGTLRVVGMNLHNYFNGDGKGGGFPTPRGAKTMAEFEQQRRRLGAAIAALNPQVLAVMELENDGFGPFSASEDFTALVEEVTAASWQAVHPPGDNTGTDAIRVGLFYRDDLLDTPVEAKTLTGPEFRKSRQPLAQVFRHTQYGGKVLIAVNHLKSKGSCPDAGANANQKDGQACWNPMRVASANKMSAWVNSLSESTQTENVLILGDMNAYRQEDPINAIRKAGFVELMDQAGGSAYSFLYYGQAGTLDYAFASKALQPQVPQAFIWHVNAGLPATMALPEPWMRFSDHDPVVVDLRLRQSSTSD